MTFLTSNDACGKLSTSRDPSRAAPIRPEFELVIYEFELGNSDFRAVWNAALVLTHRPPHHAATRPTPTSPRHSTFCYTPGIKGTPHSETILQRISSPDPAREGTFLREDNSPL